MRDRCGTACRISSTYLALTSPTTLLSPVTLPPGLERLETNPLATGSPTEIMTIGTEVVAARATLTPGVESTTRTSTLEAISSLASAGSRP